MKEIAIILSCTWKFALTFPVAIFGMKFSFWKTILITNIGGLIGLFASIFLSEIILYLWKRYVFPDRPGKRVFTRKNRFFVMIKTRFGMAGIMLFTHSLLSIPVGAFLTAKYYGITMRTVSLLIIAQFTWSLIYTVFYMYIKGWLI